MKSRNKDEYAALLPRKNPTTCFKTIFTIHIKDFSNTDIILNLYATSNLLPGTERQDIGINPCKRVPYGIISFTIHRFDGVWPEARVSSSSFVNTKRCI